MTKSNPSSTHKEWASHMRALVQGTCAVTNYWDDAGENCAPIFTSRNTEGIVATTIGLMDINQSCLPKTEIFSELIMDQRGHAEHIGNILSTIAFYIMKDGWKVAPGVIFESMVEMYIPETKLPHIMFVAPFQWQNMSKVVLKEKTIYPLVAVPISEVESQVARTNAGRDLEQRWVSQGVDVLNWERPSAA